MEETNGSSGLNDNIINNELDKVKGLSHSNDDSIDGSGMRIAVIYTKWNEKIVHSLRDGCKDQLIKRGVNENDISFYQVWILFLFLCLLYIILLIFFLGSWCI